MSGTAWGFYGRQTELDHLLEVFNRGRWFFARITGRRRIGKTSLVQEARRVLGREKLVYMQIPDAEPSGVVASARDFLGMFGVDLPGPTDLRSLAATIAVLARDGYIVVIDEFQYFHRKLLHEFVSHLQYQVDQLSRDAETVTGGLAVLGSIHTEMTALLEDRGAPLFNRVTDHIDLPHLDIASVLDILRTHADDSPERLLFLWNLFEGVPKFYRDCFEQGVLGSGRRELLSRMFFSSAPPLRNEVDNWFLREFRGRYDLILKFIARHPGCTNGELDAAVQEVDADNVPHVGGYLRVLRDRYQMVERLQPVFSRPTGRNGRFYIRDNFLRSWLAALSTAAASVSFRPVDVLLEEADRRLVDAEGHGFERLVWTLYEERSRKGVGDFGVTERLRGYWDRRGTEIDLVALSEENRTLRLGTCKRNAGKLVSGLRQADAHFARFLGLKPQFKRWRVEKVALAPTLDAEARSLVEAAGFVPQDLSDLTAGL